MKTIQMEIDDTLLAEIERVTQANGITTSEFICNTLKRVIKESSLSELEKQHEKGYKKLPISEEDIETWETEQVWGNK